MSAHSRPAAPNYTKPALILLGVNLTCAFIVLWALYGMVPVLLIAMLLNHGLTRLDQHRMQQDFR